jgi:general secretion pathway protein K
MSRRSERGFALVAVLLVLAVLGVLGAEFAFSMRLEGSAVRAFKEGVAGRHLAEAGVEQAIREIVGDYAFVAACRDDDPVRFFKADRTAVPALPRREVPLGPGQFEYDITDEEARLNVNTAPPERLRRLLESLQVQRNDRDAIVDSIQDWRDPNEEHRLNGAESDDHYLKQPLPYRSRNANLESVRELLQIKGITEAIYHGADDRPGLVREVTVKTPGPVNINTGRTHVLRALGLSEAEINQVLQARCEAPYPAVPGQFGGRGFSVSSRTFRIEARGLVDGRVAARIVTVVQKRQAESGPIVARLEWSVDR